MAAILRQEFTNHVLDEYAERGMLAEVMENSARRSLVIFARLDLGGHKVPLSFYLPDWTVEPTLWYNCWWARLLRKADYRLRRLGHRFPRLDGKLCRLGLGLQLPGWLDSLVHSQSIRVGSKRESLPTDALDRIAAMANYLMHVEETQPSKVLLGRKAMRELEGSFCADYWPDSLSHLPYTTQILGLKAQVSPFLAEDEVLVI